MSLDCLLDLALGREVQRERSPCLWSSVDGLGPLEPNLTGCMTARPWPALDEHSCTIITYTFLILYVITISLFPKYQLSVQLMRGVCRFSDTHTHCIRKL